MIEIERKFLVTGDFFIKEARKNFRIVQGYLCTDPHRTVRVRIKGSTGYLTIKGKSNEGGISRFEWEKEITVNEAKALLSLCKDHVIEKIRYEVLVGKHVFDVDVFEGHNKSLYLAEIELFEEDEPFQKPIWLGEEVTGDTRYYNSFLSNKPYLQW